MIDPQIQQKIRTVEELGKISQALRRKGKIVVHCHGVFDLVHLGHIRYLHGAKREGDILIVTVTADQFVKRGPGRPIFHEQLRAENLAALAVTDYVAIAHEPTALQAIRHIRPGIYAKGPDYKQKHQDITGMIEAEEKAVQASGGRLVITDDITFSSSQLLNRHFDSYPPQTNAFLQRLGAQFPVDTVVDAIHSMRKLKVLVVGDAIIDQYTYCAPLGMAGKEPLVVHQYQSTEQFAGGALATANHAASVVDKVDLVTVLGREDSQEKFIRAHLVSGVKPTFYSRAAAKTTVKTRFISETGGRKLFAVYHLEDQPIAGLLERRLLAWLRSRLPRYDLVIVNDFGHGLLTAKVIALICRHARQLALNVQTNSANMGFNLVTKYPRADFICIDEKELRFATHDRLGDIRSLVKKVHTQLGATVTITTRGSKGSLAYHTKQGFMATPALAAKVVDTIGAGDAFFAFTAPGFAASIPLPVLGFIGNAVGAIAVQIVGNREPVSQVDVIKFITRLLK